MNWHKYEVCPDQAVHEKQNKPDFFHPALGHGWFLDAKNDLANQGLSIKLRRCKTLQNDALLSVLACDHQPKPCSALPASSH